MVAQKMWPSDSDKDQRLIRIRVTKVMYSGTVAGARYKSVQRVAERNIITSNHNNNSLSDNPTECPTAVTAPGQIERQKYPISKRRGAQRSSKKRCPSNHPKRGTGGRSRSNAFRTSSTAEPNADLTGRENAFQEHPGSRRSLHSSRKLSFPL